LMVKTYLGLPQRVTRIPLSRTAYSEMSESFPRLLDGLERYAADKLDGINLGEIEWYHRLRNQLYHQGNGLTVEREKVQVYAELPKLLFKNLFGFELRVQTDPDAELLGSFMQAWSTLEQTTAQITKLIASGPSHRPISPAAAASLLYKMGYIDGHV